MKPANAKAGNHHSAGPLDHALVNTPFGAPTVYGIAAEINRWHDLAVEHAEKAVEHARRAGMLLLKVKADIPHGEFIPWVEANVHVTPRQAQRYMAAAQGKPIPVRAIKHDTPVSHLPRKSSDELLLDAMKPGSPAESWVHHVAKLGLCASQGAWFAETDVWVDPASTDGWFFVVKFQDAMARVMHFGRPLNLAGVAIALDLCGAQLDEARGPTDSPFVMGATFTKPDGDAGRYAQAEACGLMAAEGAR